MTEEKIRVAVCPGSFDPVTNGHIDIISRTAKMFDKVIVAVGVNPKKTSSFTVEERVEMLRKASSMAVCKINMDTDIRLAMTAAVRKSLAEKPEAFDPRGYLGEARKDIEAMVEKKITEVLGSANSMND